MEIMLLIVVISAIWIAFDASHLGVQSGCISGGMNTGPTGYFIGALLLWIVFFPVYLSNRPKYVALRVLYPSGKLPTVAARERALASGQAPVTPVSTAASSQQTNFEALEQLSKMYAAGLLSDAEFNIKKAEIIGRV